MAKAANLGIPTHVYRSSGIRRAIMASHALHPYPPISHLARWLVVGFISGTVAVLFFHQGVLAILHSLGVASRAPFSMQAVAPFGIPQVWSLAFWGGIWGVVLAISLRRWDGPALVAGATPFRGDAPPLIPRVLLAPLT